MRAGARASLPENMSNPGSGFIIILLNQAFIICMPEDFSQLSINKPTDISAGCALLAAGQQLVAWFETGFGFLA